jgi:hypothetical protein
MDLVNLNMIHTLQQCRTPLNTLFFSEYNINLLQRAVRQQFKNKTNLSIDFQNKDDLMTIMRAVFVNNSSNPYGETNSQVKQMNCVVIKKAVEQITTGVSQYMGYMKTIDSPINPMANPISTNMYGNKMDLNNKIGI